MAGGWSGVANFIVTEVSSDGAAASELSLLVARAAAGDQAAWEQLVERYSRLLRSVTRGFRLADGDAADVIQTTWMRLLEHIGRVDPDRVGAWLRVTARRECLRVIALRKRLVLTYDESTFDEVPAVQADPDERLLTGERAGEVRKAMETLPERWQQMLDMLMADPPCSYAEIAEKLEIPIGSIGPIRGRCLDKLRAQLGPLSV